MKLLPPNAFFDRFHKEAFPDRSAMIGWDGSDRDWNGARISMVNDSFFPSIGRLVGGDCGMVGSNVLSRQHRAQRINTLDSCAKMIRSGRVEKNDRSSKWARRERFHVERLAWTGVWNQLFGSCRHPFVAADGWPNRHNLPLALLQYTRVAMRLPL